MPALPNPRTADWSALVDAAPADPGHATRLFADALATTTNGEAPVVFGAPRPAFAHAGPEYAGGLYERLLHRGDRKRQGAWFTPPALARAIVERALTDAPVPERIVDPAVGCGAFLVAAGRALHARGVAARDIGRHLFGVDLDADAVACARHILACAGFTVPEENLEVGDALEWDRTWPGGGPDLVVGNPPFQNIVRLPDEVRATLPHRFKTFRNKCDLYGLFVEAAAERVAPGGRIALLVTSSFLGTSSFAPLRRMLFADDGASCHRVDEVTGDAFGGAAVYPRVVYLQEGPRPAKVAFGVMSANGGVGADRWVDAGFLARRAPRSAVIPEDPRELLWAEAVEAAGTPLGDYVELSLGVKTGDDGRFVDTRQRTPHFVPSLRGRELSRWCVERETWLDYRPEVLKTVHGARPRKPEHFQRPLKLLVRETAGKRIIAAADTEGRVPLDTVHVLFAKPEGPRASLWAVLACLNAQVTSRWYGMHHPGPHVKASELRGLPVPLLGPVDDAMRAEAIAATVAYVARGEGEVPAACLAAGARAAVLDVLGRYLSGPVDGLRREVAVGLLDAVVEAGYADG